MTSPDKMLDLLPVYQWKRELISGSQTIAEIKQELLDAHKLHARDYDKISVLFTGGNVPKKLFEFCQQYFPYEIEDGQAQTSQPPAGIIEQATENGVDCKHYALFIAGVLDSLNRKGYGNYNGAFRFARYKGHKREDHVFVVLFTPDGSEIWIDPTPIYERLTGRWIERTFNDRLLVPISYTDKKFSNMALYRMSGLEQYNAAVGTAYIVPAFEGSLQKNSCCENIGGSDPYDPGSDPFDPINYGWTNDPTAGTPKTNQVQVDPKLQAAASADPTAAAIIQGAQKLVDSLPDGGLKNFLKSFLADPGGAVKSILFGKKYTSGDYHLGEIYMRNILGMSDIQNRGQVPDAIVPQAWDFFSSALGVRIGSADHLDALAKGADSYYAWLGKEADYIPRANVERAYRILRGLGYPENQADARRNSTWVLNQFAAEPYVYPIYNNTYKGLFNGTHPILNTRFDNGYPYLVNTETGEPFNTGDKFADDNQKAGFSLGALLLIGAVAVGLAVRGNKPETRRQATPY